MLKAKQSIHTTAQRNAMQCWPNNWNFGIYVNILNGTSSAYSMISEQFFFQLVRRLIIIWTVFKSKTHLVFIKVRIRIVEWKMKMCLKMVNVFWAFIACVLLFSEHFIVYCQLVNQMPYFVSGSGDMSRFSLSENTPVDSPVYQLKGNLF